MKHPYRIVHLDLCGSELSSFLCGRVLYYNTAVSAEYRRVVGVACVSESVCARERVRGKGPLCVIYLFRKGGCGKYVCARAECEWGLHGVCGSIQAIQPDLQPYLDLWSAASELRRLSERVVLVACTWTWTRRLE